MFIERTLYVSIIVKIKNDDRERKRRARLKNCYWHLCSCSTDCSARSELLYIHILKASEKTTITNNELLVMTTTSMCACLTREVIVKYPREEKKRIEFSKQTNSFCMTPSNRNE